MSTKLMFWNLVLNPVVSSGTISTMVVATTMAFGLGALRLLTIMENIRSGITVNRETVNTHRIMVHKNWTSISKW